MKKNNRISEEERALISFKEMYQMVIVGKILDKEIKSIVNKLLAIQKPDGSWSVIDNYHCDSDARVQYVYFPTYYATATLINIANNIGMNETMKVSLSKGLTFAMGRNLLGHGYNSVAEQVKVLDIYKEAGMYEFLINHGETFKDFSTMVTNIIDGYKNCVEENKTVFDWLVDFKKEFEKVINDYEESVNKEIWYFAYGSNICYERFMKYIHSCTEQTKPVAIKNKIIPHNIYFAGKSRTWNDKAVAFLDDTRVGMTMGRMYRISYKQYGEIQRMEGNSYAKQITLGKEDGIPIYTFTANEKRKDIGAPDSNYVEVILKGLQEAYEEKSLLTLESYLYSRIFNGEDYLILNYIRNSEHGVTVQKIIENTAVSKMKVTKSVNKLISYRLLKQDSRSVMSKQTVANGNAVLYTVTGKRELLDVLLLSKHNE